jgi:hypothetical protein
MDEPLARTQGRESSIAREANQSASGRIFGPRKFSSMLIFDGYYLAIKAAFFFGLVHSFVKYETLQKSWLFLGLLYTAGVALLSWVWIVAPGRVQTGTWQIWLGWTAVIAVVYFKLLERFDEGWMFWTLIVAGLGVVYF